MAITVTHATGEGTTEAQYLLAAHHVVEGTGTPAAHAASHAVGGADAVLPADPAADKYLKWNDTTNAIEWADASGTGNAINAFKRSWMGL